jgi:hypothetical protein
LRAVEFHHPALDDDAPAATVFDGGGLMANEKNGAALARHMAHAAGAFLLGGAIPHGQQFIDDHDLRFEMCGHREGEPHDHATRIRFTGVSMNFSTLEKSTISSNLASISSLVMPRRRSFKRFRVP